MDSFVAHRYTVKFLQGDYVRRSLTDNIGNAPVIVLLVHTYAIMYVIGQYVHLLCMGRCEHQYKKY